jgi:hypothetical protein
LPSKPLRWLQFEPVIDKLPIWVSYFFAVLCSAGMGYSLGSAGTGLLELQPPQILLIAVTAGAVIAIFLLDRKRRLQDRQRAERAERIRVKRETMAAQLLDPVDRSVIEALDRIATAKGVDRAVLIPAILQQYIERKSYEEARRGLLQDHRSGESHPSAEWMKTLPAWLETLPGSLDIKRRPTPYSSF